MSGFWQKKHIARSLALFGVSLVLFFVYMHLYTDVLGWELPKTSILKRRNANLATDAKVLARRIQEYDTELGSLQLRDEDIYRSIFGLNSIPVSVRDGGLQGGGKYEGLDNENRSGNVSSLLTIADKAVKKAYVQSKSYDEIELMLSTADNRATSIPSICPVMPDSSAYRISSPFGYRRHPVLGYSRFHSGIDFALKPGNPVYATGDGEVESIKIEMRGYGRQVVINHGFGYTTRYAHLDRILVTEGMKVKRGEQLATTGNTGLSSGPHLHYEVMYKGKNVNPYHYFDNDISLDQYTDMLDKADPTTSQYYVHPMHRK